MASRRSGSEGHLYRGSRFDDVADLVVSYGELRRTGLEHRILVVNEEELLPGEQEELRRRDEWISIASSTPSSDTGL